jgi:hypothetical protein
MGGSLRSDIQVAAIKCAPDLQGGRSRVLAYIGVLGLSFDPIAIQRRVFESFFRTGGLERSGDCSCDEHLPWFEIPGADNTLCCRWRE